MGRAKKSNLKINHDTQLTPEQIAQLKKIEEQPIVPRQLPGQSEYPSQDSQDRMIPADGQSLITPDPAKNIVTARQIAVTQASQALEAQHDHIRQTRLQQADANGLQDGVLEAIVRQNARIEGIMLVQDALFQSETAQDEKNAEKLADLLGEHSDFLNRRSPAAQTYCESGKVGATANVDIMQAIERLRNN